MEKVVEIPKHKITELKNDLEKDLYNLPDERQANQYKPGSLTQEYARKIAPMNKNYRESAQVYNMPIKTGDMIAYEEDVLAESLKEYISIDSDIELRKNRLALKSDFSLPDLYIMFDTHNIGFFNFR